MILKKLKMSVVLSSDKPKNHITFAELGVWDRLSPWAINQCGKEVISKMLTTELQTERLYLRKMKLSDSPSLFKTWSDPDVTKFMNINCFTEENQAKDMIKLLDELSQDNKAIRFSIIKIESNEIVGSCGYDSLDFENAKAEIGFDIARAFWGKGYAPEAVDSLLNYAYSSLKLNRVEAKVEPENVNSIKVLQKLNFTLEGTLRQYERVNGKFIDVSIYSKLKTD